MRKKLTDILKRVLQTNELTLESPEDEGFGDYSSNIAMTMFSQYSTKNTKTPKELAEKIVVKLKKDKNLSKIIEKSEVAGPGFINFWLNKQTLLDTVVDINTKKDIFGKSDEFESKKVMFEFGQPNTHKLPHIGHLYSYIFGESMSRIMEAVGWKVFRANYQGDVGLHVAKCLWAFQKEKPEVPESLQAKTELLQKMYQNGSYKYENDKKAKAEIDKLNLKVYAQDKEVSGLWRETRQWSLDYYQEFEKRIGVFFDRYYFESEVSGPGKAKVKRYLGKVFKESRGAIIFEGSKYGLHDRVFVTKFDTPTYEAKDFYLQELKMKGWPADLLIISTANEQNDYFKVVFKALELAHPGLAGKLMHIGFGMVNLKSGKMSSRTGEIIGASELVESVVERARKLSENDEIAEKVGIGAVKYSFLKNNPLQDTKFDIEESIASEGNSASYLQYTYARTRSVMAKARNHTFKGSSFKGVYSNFAFNTEELAVMRSLARFSDTIIDAANNYSPNLLCAYLFDLARKYNNFYARHRIIGSERTRNEVLSDNKHRTPENKKPGERESRSDFRIALTAATGQVVKNGLKLLGIETLERM